MVIVPPSPKPKEVHFQEAQLEAEEPSDAISEDNPAQNSDEQHEPQPEPVIETSLLTGATPGDSEETLILQTPEPEVTIIVSTALSPVEEMSPSSATEVPSIPTPISASDTRSDSPSESTLLDTSVYVEPEVPDPFLIEEEDDTSSSDKEEDERETSVGPSATSSEPPAAQEIALTVSTLTGATTSPVPSEPPMLSPLNVNKDVPPPPPGETEQEEETPELFLPGLIIPTMFLPIPNVRRSFYSSNMLLWWLPKSSSMYLCNRRIR